MSQTADRSSAGKYSLTITDPNNKMVGGKLTITVDVEDNALKELRASDDDGNAYEIAFRIKKQGVKNSSAPQPTQPAKGNKATVASTSDATVDATAADEAGGVAKPKGPDGDKKHDGNKGHGNGDECQCCVLINGHLNCQPCPCPQQP